MKKLDPLGPREASVIWEKGWSDAGFLVILGMFPVDVLLPGASGLPPSLHCKPTNSNE